MFFHRHAIDDVSPTTSLINRTGIYLWKQGGEESSGKFFTHILTVVTTSLAISSYLLATLRATCTAASTVMPSVQTAALPAGSCSDGGCCWSCSEEMPLSIMDCKEEAWQGEHNKSPSLVVEPQWCTVDRPQIIMLTLRYSGGAMQQ